MCHDLCKNPFDLLLEAKLPHRIEDSNVIEVLWWLTLTALTLILFCSSCTVVNLTVDLLLEAKLLQN